MCNGSDTLDDQRDVARPQRLGCDVGAYEKVRIAIHLPLVLQDVA